jgi:hypothetical protein
MAVKGAVVTSTCIWMARHGKSKQEIYTFLNNILVIHDSDEQLFKKVLFSKNA